jgi:peptidoglycan/xylan/chitin deacetylase (PgdA/CDA1 family)
MIQSQETIAPTAIPEPGGTRSWVRPLLIAANYSAPVALIGTHFRFPWMIAAAICVHSCFFYAIASPTCGWLGPIVTRFRPRGNDVWLTIDDGPAGEASVWLGKELERRGARATFFVKGASLARDPGIGRALIAAGHTLANHTHTHPVLCFWWRFPSTLGKQIDQCNEALREAGARVTRWFRSPVGLKHVFLQPVLARRRMRLIAWNVRGHDGLNCNPDAVARRVEAQAAPGAVIVLHEGKPRSNEAILRVVDELQARGFSFVIPDDDQLI